MSRLSKYIPAFMKPQSVVCLIKHKRMVMMTITWVQDHPDYYSSEFLFSIMFRNLPLARQIHANQPLEIHILHKTEVQQKINCIHITVKFKKEFLSSYCPSSVHCVTKLDLIGSWRPSGYSGMPSGYTLEFLSVSHEFLCISVNISYVFMWMWIVRVWKYFRCVCAKQLIYSCPRYI